MDMMCKIWILTPSQVDFPDTIPMWMTLTGIDDEERVQKIRKRFLQPGLELFAKKTKKKVSFLVQKGMRKEKVKQVKNSKQNSENARKGWETRRYGNASALPSDSVSKKSAMPSLSSSSSYSNSNKQRVVSFNSVTMKKQRKEIGEMLSGYLGEKQIENIFKFMPDVPREYIDEKIKLVVDKQPNNPGGFLYSAIMQNYQPNGNNGGDVPRWLQIAVNRALSKKEFEKVPGEEKHRFRENILCMPASVEFELISKPKKTANIIEKKLFQQMDKGDRVSGEQFKKMREELKSNFKKVLISNEDEVSYTLK